MKGLLLKDFYLMKKYCRTYLFIAAIFAITSVYTDNLFFIFYPCILISLIPMTLYTYDEKERWCAYCLTLPVKRSQYVNAKYFCGIICTIIISAVMTLAYGLKSTENINLLNFSVLLAANICVGLLCQSVTLPLVLKFGAEKARMIYYLIICIACATSVIIFQGVTFTKFKTDLFGITFFVLIIVLYAFSWIISIKIFEKKEL